MYVKNFKSFNKLIQDAVYVKMIVFCSYVALKVKIYFFLTYLQQFHFSYRKINLLL